MSLKGEPKVTAARQTGPAAELDSVADDDAPGEASGRLPEAAAASKITFTASPLTHLHPQAEARS